YTGSGYSTYANGTEVAPIAGVDNNYAWARESTWNVGTGTMEQNGTYDMMGNAWEWTETYIDTYHRVFRGGAFTYYDETILSSAWNELGIMESEGPAFGFRIVSVPEPVTLVFLSLGGFVLVRRRRV
ncbi:MAG: SUMF1/EgtB/PvdO family nonheme iron enzyme, partial [Sedimentisphaerales bacterium]|nr:SUMF1/EgtB/PvdO family nonheme iron enzyme [Sedimentisphaerales bacterium]